jgi:hypothetical protein
MGKKEKEEDKKNGKKIKTKKKEKEKDKKKGKKTKKEKKKRRGLLSVSLWTCTVKH